MKKLLLILVIGVTSLGYADSLDDAAKAVLNKEVTEEGVKEIFSESDFKRIQEKIKKLKLEELKNKNKENKERELLIKRNKELEEENRKYRQNKSKKTVNEVVQEVLKGNYGDNPIRIEKLKKEGFTLKEIQEIQKRVNKLVELEKNK